MTLRPETIALIAKVREEVKPKGLLAQLFKGKSAPAGEPSLEGLEVYGYRIGALLGEGNAGVVFAATDPEGAEVAVKMLPVNQDESAGVLFQREVEIGKSIDHPAVVKTLRTFDLAGAQFVVMEKVEGSTLRDLLTSPLPRERFLHLFSQLVEGLQTAHDQGVVHRDLKPENIMITSCDRLKVLDFGMARVEKGASVTSTGTFKGTIRYTAPEQIQDSKRVGPACDQFALGLLIVEALTGQLPYEIDDRQPMVTLMNRMSATAKPLNAIDSSFSTQSSEVVAKMLSPTPEDRFGSVSEAYQSLVASL